MPAASIRARVRAEMTEEIKQVARQHLATDGANLSLRAVARDMGMVSSAVYRYFPSRDDLLTALIIDAYDDLGTAAEQALAALDQSGDVDPLDRWVAVCRAARDWAVAHPHEYALIHGTPVPGYRAPGDTVGPASRVGLALVRVASEAHQRGRLEFPRGRALPGPVRADVVRFAVDVAPELPIPTAAALVAVWAQLFGIISFEVFGQFDQLVEARAEFFAHAAAALAVQVGIRDTPPAVDAAGGSPAGEVVLPAQ